MISVFQPKISLKNSSIICHLLVSKEYYQELHYYINLDLMNIALLFIPFIVRINTFLYR